MIAQTDNSVELRRQAMQANFDRQQSSADRNRLGQFATPRALAIEITEQLAALLPIETFPIRFADPSIGLGSFFSAVLSIFGRQRIASAMGIEIDAALCHAARDIWADTGLAVVCEDFTRFVASTMCPSAPNIVLANPPYVRHHHIERREKERLQALVLERTGVKVSGLTGLYVYFLLLTTSWMEEGGHAGWLIPSEFMDVNYGAALKTFLLNSVSLIRVHRFDPRNPQFKDAMVSSAVLFFKKTAPGADHTVQFTFGDSLAHPAATETISRCRLINARKWTAYPQSRNQECTSHVASGGTTLGDFFRIKRGIATGGNKFFIIDRADAHKRGIPTQFLRPILPSPRQLQPTVIEVDGDGFPNLPGQLVLIDCDVPEPLVELRYPALWRYLSGPDSLVVRNGYLVGKRYPWYAQEQRDPAPFLCTYMGRGSDENKPFHFIWNRSQAVATNLYLMLYPRGNLAAILRRQPEMASEVFKMLGDIPGHELRGEGRVYGDGLHKIEPKELARISADSFIRRWPELATGTQEQYSLSLFR